MRSRSVLTLGLLFWFSFGAVWNVTRAYSLSIEPEVEFAESQKQTIAVATSMTTPSKLNEQEVQTQSPKGSKGQDDSSAILFPVDEGRMECEDTHTCATLDECTSFTKTNDICGWNDTLPLVCCLKTTTRGTNANLNVQLDTRIFPENECFRRVFSRRKRQIFPELDYEEEEKTFVTTVVGGKDVKNITQWPFMVSIFRRIGENRMFVCGGALISRKHVLTAAHCFLNIESGSEYDVISGLVNLKSIENGRETFTIHPVTNIRLHPNFRFPQLHDDIALLTIRSIEVFNPTTRLVCLPPALPVGGKQAEADVGGATILGWGNTKFNGEPSDQLQEAFVDLVDRSNCEQANKGANPLFSRSFPRGITPEVVCAGNTDLSKDACQGDSGGPLVVLDEDSVWRLVGVVSAGFQCGVVGVPGIYTRVNRYLEWIKVTAITN